MSDLQHYDATNGQMPLGWGDVDHLPRAALIAAKRGNPQRADEVELEHIRRTQEGPVVDEDGGRIPGFAHRLIRGFGRGGQLAVEWRTISKTIYTDIDGKEITP